MERIISRLVCAACGYDLSGSPRGRCPECGSTEVADAQAVIADRQAGWRWLIAAAIVLSMVQFAWGGGSDPWVQSFWFAAVWVLAFGWVYAMRASVLGARPWLILLLLPVAGLAWDRPNIDGTHQLVFQVLCALIAITSFGFAFWRNPRQCCGGAMLLVSIFLWLGAGVMVLGAVIGGDDSTFRVAGAEFKGGGVGNAIAAVIGFTTAGAAWFLYRCAATLLCSTPQQQ